LASLSEALLQQAVRLNQCNAQIGLALERVMTKWRPSHEGKVKDSICARAQGALSRNSYGGRKMMLTQKALAIGDRVAGMVVLESEPTRLVLAKSRRVLLLEFGASLLFLTGGCMLAVAINGPVHPGTLWMFIIGVALFVVACSHLVKQRLVVDWDARTVASGWGPSAKRWSLDDIAAIRLDIGHVGRVEMLELGVQTAVGVRTVLVRAGSQKHGQPLTRAGLQIAAMLRLPIERAGEVVQGDAALRRDLDTLQPQATAGDGRDLIIHCPKCKNQNVRGVAWEHVERHHMVTHRTNWVKCLNCNTSLYCPCSLDELIGLSPEEIAKIIYYRKSLIDYFLVTAALVLCILPVIGLVMSAISLAVNSRHGGWLKRLSLIAFCISMPVTLVSLIVLSFHH
jgi:hypothetical protein